MKQILLIENDPNIMCINSGALRMRNYDVLQAFSLKEAIQIISDKQPDIIVMESLLPDGSGLDFCKKIKQKIKIPILFLSRCGDNAEIVAGFRVGGDDYMTKPYDLNVLISRIEARLRSAGYPK